MIGSFSGTAGLVPIFVIYIHLFVSGVACHGFVHSVNTGGQDYAGWNPFTDPYASPVAPRVIRKIPSDGPITNIHDSNLACNTGGETGTSLLAQASPGGNIVFSWAYWPGDHLGPVWTYMTSCQGDCSNFDASNGNWFKIDAAGYENGQWASAKLIGNNASWTSKVPDGLAAGQYLVRHEIVALHSIGAPQFYPSCTQVEVTGSGSGNPSESDLVKIPGLFDSTNWPNIYTDFGSFAIPGPSVVSFGSSSPPSNTPTTTSATPTFQPANTTESNPYTTATEATTFPSTAAHTSTASAGKSSGRCALTKSRKLVRRHKRQH